MSGTVLRTERLALHPARRSDAPELYAAYASDPAVSRALPWDVHVAVTDTYRYLATCEARRARGEAFAWVVRRGRPDGRALGLCTLDAADRLSTLGYALGSAFWGRGLMTEAARRVVGWGFAVLELDRISAYCGASNRASARVLEKIGFEREGQLRRFRDPTRPTAPAAAPPRDALLYAATRERWSPRSRPSTRGRGSRSGAPAAVRP